MELLSQTPVLKMEFPLTTPVSMLGLIVEFELIEYIVD